MKLVRLQRTGGPEVLECIEVPVPEPRAGEVLVRACAIGVGRPDILIRSGRYKWMPALPAVPGTELAGVIEQVGAAVPPCRVGQRVLVSARELVQRGGCYAECVAVPAHATYPLPDSASFEAGACLANYQLAFHLLHDAALARPGQFVLVHGAAGGVGNAIIDWARHLRLTAIAVVGNAAKAEFAARIGAEHVINRESEPVVDRIREITQGRGVDIVFDPVGWTILDANLASLAELGTIVVYADLGGESGDDIGRLLQERAAHAPAIRRYSIHYLDRHPERRRAGMRAVLQALAAGVLRPQVHARLPLDAAAHAHAMLESGEVMGKIILRP
jgi:NADPH2:quinone reductase